MAASFVTAADGTQLSVRVTGLANGPACVLLDGIGCDGYIWRYLRPFLRRHARVIHMHYRGHGLSAIPQDDKTLTIEQCGHDVWQVLDSLHVQDVILFGHSMGVQVALATAHQNPQRIHALVLACGAFEKPLDTFHGSDLGARVLPVLSGALFRWTDKVRDAWQRYLPTEAAYWLAVATEINSKMIRRDDFLPYLAHMSKMDPVVFMKFLQSAAAHSSRAYLHELTAPALVVAASQDHFTPAHLSQQLAHLLPNAEICMMPGASHAAPLELPDLLELRLEEFARRVALWP